MNNGPATSQEFTLINNEAFTFPKSDEFVAFVVAATSGGSALFKFLIERYGLLGGSARLSMLVKSMGKPLGGFATEPVFSGVPMACGPYAVRVRLVPAAMNGTAVRNANKDWGADFSDRLKTQALAWELQLQPFINQTLTLIEDASVNWASPYTTVARLTLPVQDSASAVGKAVATKVESVIFDPWQALAAHRPFGDSQRARKVVYFSSQKGRGAA